MICRLLKRMNYCRQVINLLLLLIFLVTNLFYYSLQEPSISHVYSFAFIATFIDQLHLQFLSVKPWRWVLPGIWRKLWNESTNWLLSLICNSSCRIFRVYFSIFGHQNSSSSGFLVLALFQLFQAYQYNTNVLPDEYINKAKYGHLFLKHGHQFHCIYPPDHEFRLSKETWQALFW